MLSSFRLAPGWRYLLLAVPPILLAAAVAAAWLFVPTAPGADTTAALAGAPAGVEAAPPAAPAVAGLLVDVTGAVAQPGLYRMQRGERVYAAIAAAGGLTGDADPTKLPNLAGVLRDGMQIKVASRKSTASGSARAGYADLNSASAEELAAVPGFSPELAQAAVNYRANFGGFASTRELVTQLGMGVAEFAQARRYLRV